MYVLRRRPFFEKDGSGGGSEDTSNLGIMVKYMEKTIRLEEERKKDKEDLQSQISDVRKDMSETIDNRLGTFQERFDSLDKKLEEMSKSKEVPPNEQNPTEVPTQTQVDETLPISQQSSLTSPPTKIHPPDVPKGIRGRRRYKREHKNQ